MAIVQGVEKVTHLIPESDTCLGEVVVQRACFNAPARMLGLCMGLTPAPYVTTTEVYPDSPTVTDEVMRHIFFNYSYFPPLYTLILFIGMYFGSSGSCRERSKIYSYHFDNSLIDVFP